MIADSPYTSAETILTATEGAIAGLMGAVWMLAFLMIIRPLSEHQHSLILTRWAPIINFDCRRACGTTSLLFSGALVFHGVLGAMFGTLYALSQVRIPARNLFIVGLFYGIVLWAVSGLAAGPIGGAELKGMIRAWPWLLASLGFGTWLSTVAVWVQARRPSSTRVAFAD